VQVLLQAPVSSWLPTLASSALNFLVIVGLMLFNTMYHMFMQETFFAGLHRYLPFLSQRDAAGAGEAAHEKRTKTPTTSCHPR
jgi:predicted PurR-regulated permease PerM